MPGRRPHPTAVKKAAGNPGHKRLNKFEAQPAIALPQCPKHLDKVAREEWDRIAPELFANRLVSEVDRAALANYCIAWSHWVAAELELQGQDFVIETPNGSRVQNPLVAIAYRLSEQIRKFAIEFGMTPASRSKVVAVDMKAVGDTDLHTKLSGPELSDEQRRQLQ